MNQWNDLLYVDGPALIIFNCLIELKAALETAFGKHTLVHLLDIVIFIGQEEHAIFH